MAEIKVEPKRGGLGWLWALLAVVLLAIIVWYFMRDSDVAPVTTPADSVRTSLNEASDTRDLVLPGVYVVLQETRHG